MPAAVVRPLTWSTSSPLRSVLRIVPAPRKPTPAINPCNTRLRSAALPPACCATMTISAAPMDTSIWVRMPAALPWISRCQPSRPPSNAASVSRSTTRVSCSISLTSANSEATVRPTMFHQLSIKLSSGSFCAAVAAPATTVRHGADAQGQRRPASHVRSGLRAAHAHVAAFAYSQDADLVV